MPARPQTLNRGSSRRISSTIRKMEKNSKGTSPPQKLTSRIRPNLQRRTRSPRSGTKTLERSPIKRRLSPSPKLILGKKHREGMRIPPKRARDTSKHKSKSPLRPTSSSLPPRRPMSREQYSYTERDDSSKRKFKNISPEKTFIEKPSSELPINRDELKSIKMICRNVPGDESEINRRIVHPEEITITRRPGIMRFKCLTRPIVSGGWRNLGYPIIIRIN